MGPFDIILTILYILSVMLIGLVIKSQHKGELIYEKYFMKGLIVKMLGSVMFALVYTYYYTYGGDTKTYFHDASVLVDVLLKSPLDYWRILWASTEELNRIYYETVANLDFDIGTSEWFTVKLTSMAAFFGFKNYFATTIVFSAVSYIGIWKFYTVLYRRYSNVHRALAFSLLFVPSVFFWGSGIMKDCIVIGALGLVIYQTDKFIISRPIRRIVPSLMFLFCAFIIFNVKAYVIISLVPAMIIWIIMNIKDNIENSFVRSMLLPLLVIGAALFVAFALEFMGQFSDKYNTDTVFTTAENMQNWHYLDGSDDSHINGRGSSYTLGDYEPTLFGTMKMFIPAVNVTYFRPYFWEVENVAMLAAAIESAFVLAFSIFIFMGLGFFRVLRLLNSDAFLLMSLTFALFFGFAVGFSTYNFGALARYKIPCMPFYLGSLFILQYKVKEMKLASRRRKGHRRKEAQSFS